MKNYSHKFLMIFIIYLSGVGIVQKYGGIWGNVAYLIYLGFVFFYLLPEISRFLEGFSNKQLILYLGLFLLFSLTLFEILNPTANNRNLFGGSDTDEALNTAIDSLLKGEYPYYQKTYLGNKITPMPGALFLGIPFYFLFGNAAYQNFLWITVFIFLLTKLFNSLIDTAVIIIILFFTSPLFYYHLSIGSDYLGNSIYVFCAVYFYVMALHENSRVTILASIIFLGVTLSSRANFLLLLPVISVFTYYSIKLKNLNVKFYEKENRNSLIITAISTIGITLIFLVITLPFYIYDPANFSPLHTTYKLSRFQEILPGSIYVIPFVSTVVGLIYVYLHRRQVCFNVLLKACAMILIVPIITGVVLMTIQNGELSLGYTYYSTFFTFFAITSLWQRDKLTSKNY